MQFDTYTIARLHKLQTTGHLVIPSWSFIHVYSSSSSSSFFGFLVFFPPCFNMFFLSSVRSVTERGILLLRAFLHFVSKFNSLHILPLSLKVVQLAMSA